VTKTGSCKRFQRLFSLQKLISIHLQKFTEITALVTPCGAVCLPAGQYAYGVPSGVVHETINLAVLGAATVAYLNYGQGQLEQQVGLACAGAYLIGTFLVTPDLDLAEQKVRPKGRWGLLGMLWVPYGWMFSHRGISHTWIVGPLTRLLYMALMGVVLYWLVVNTVKYFGVEFSWRAKLTAPPQEIVWAGVLGYYVSQWLHVLADYFWPDFGRR
jgi:uncharacterized metal-binding protein